jgi:prolycopene isomerase
VTRIVVSHGRTHGVELEGGLRVDAPLVISNVDARDTLGRLVAVDDVPGRFLHRLQRTDLSLSIFVVYAATDLDVRALGAQRDVILSTSWDHERTYEAALAGQVTNLSILIPTLADPTLAPPGEHLVILQTVAADQAGLGAHDDAYRVDRMLELAEQVLPGLRQHLTYLDQVGPDATTSLHHMGPIYGWAGSPQTTGMGRLAQHTPVGGLLLAGQWTRPGPGVATVVQSGIGAARLALGTTTDAPALPLRL